MRSHLLAALVSFGVALASCLAQGAESPSSERQQSGRLPLLDPDAAWRRLPKLDHEPEDRRLSHWARALAGPLPRTTAALLELDYLYRTSDAIPPRLRGQMRWIAATANRCAYSQRYAEADLLRAGMSRDDIAHLAARVAAASGAEGAALRFAGKLTMAASSVTDDEVAELISTFGEPAVVAMVLQLAYANFQDRLLLTLDVGLEPDGPYDPNHVRFVAPAAGESLAAERPDVAPAPTVLPKIDLGTEWTSVSLDQLRRGMDLQRARSGRISVPAWAAVFPRLPPGLYPADRPIRIQWSLVVLGHQPTLGAAWMKCLRTFAREANQDRVFEESLFWVITRAIDCFY